MPSTESLIIPVVILCCIKSYSSYGSLRVLYSGLCVELSIASEKNTIIAVSREVIKYVLQVFIQDSYNACDLNKVPSTVTSYRFV